MIETAGDRAFVVRLGDGIDPALGGRVLALLAHLDATRPAGVVDIVPGYASVLVIHEADPDEIRRWLEDAGEPPAAAPTPRRIEIPVVYDGPDLAALAHEKGLRVDEVIALHTAPAYRCYMLGFRPGFPFLGGLDDRLVAPRLSTPRVRVPAGSVGIGGRQTGVYPVASPGGWRLIGRTTTRLFDPERPDPFLVHPGDAVVFVPTL